MKCDELKEIFIVEGYYTEKRPSPLFGDCFGYGKEEVDEAITELKARIQLDDDEMAGFLDLEEECGGGDLRNYIAELNAKLSEKDKELESLKASHFEEMADAGMENRIIKRALWLARAERASDKARIFYFAMTENVDLNINGYSHKEKRHTRMLTARWWEITWLRVERKCRAKAELYK